MTAAAAFLLGLFIAAVAAHAAPQFNVEGVEWFPAKRAQLIFVQPYLLQVLPRD